MYASEKFDAIDGTIRLIKLDDTDFPFYYQKIDAEILDVA